MTEAKQGQVDAVSEQYRVAVELFPAARPGRQQC